MKREREREEWREREGETKEGRDGGVKLGRQEVCRVCALLSTLVLLSGTGTSNNGASVRIYAFMDLCLLAFYSDELRRGANSGG